MRHNYERTQRVWTLSVYPFPQRSTRLPMLQCSSHSSAHPVPAKPLVADPHIVATGEALFFAGRRLFRVARRPRGVARLNGRECVSPGGLLC